MARSRRRDPLIRPSGTFSRRGEGDSAGPAERVECAGSQSGRPRPTGERAGVRGSGRWRRAGSHRNQHLEDIRLIIRRGHGEMRAVGAPGQAVGQCPGRDPLVEERPGLVGVPDEEEAGRADRGQPASVSAVSDGVDVVGMAVELVQFLAVGDVPDPDRLVHRARRQLAAVGVEGDGIDRVPVALALAQLLAVGDVPVLDQLVVAAGGEDVSPGVEGHRVDRRGVGRDRPDLRPLDRVPDPGRLVGGPGGRELAVRAPRHAVDRAGVAREGLHRDDRRSPDFAFSLPLAFSPESGAG